MSQFDISGTPLEYFSVPLHKTITKECFPVPLEKPVTNMGLRSISCQNYHPIYDDLDYVQKHVSIHETLNPTESLLPPDRDFEIEKRITERENIFLSTGAYAYGGMGMDGNSPALLAEKYEELDYIKKHPELYKKP